jgi:hypothetical protein
VPGQWSVSHTRRLGVASETFPQKSGSRSVSRRRRVAGGGSVGLTGQEIAEKSNRSERSFSSKQRCSRNIGIAGQKVAEESSGIACTFCSSRYFSGCHDSSG